MKCGTEACIGVHRFVLSASCLILCSLSKTAVTVLTIPCVFVGSVFLLPVIRLVADDRVRRSWFCLFILKHFLNNPSVIAVRWSPVSAITFVLFLMLQGY